MKEKERMGAGCTSPIFLLPPAGTLFLLLSII